MRGTIPNVRNTLLISLDSRNERSIATDWKAPWRKLILLQVTQSLGKLRRSLS
jgi:hypothetical protein